MLSSGSHELKLCPAAKVLTKLNAALPCSPGNGCVLDCGGNPRGEWWSLTLQVQTSWARSAGWGHLQSLLSGPVRPGDALGKGHTAGLRVQEPPPLPEAAYTPKARATPRTRMEAFQTPQRSRRSSLQWKENRLSLRKGGICRSRNRQMLGNRF